MKAYERLLQYVKFPTVSDPSAPAERCPSTAPQRALANALAEEMRALGFDEARVDANGYVYGSLAANCETGLPPLGLIAHMDVSDGAPSADIRPHIVRGYDGGDLVLNAEQGIVMRAAEHPVLAACKGQDLLVTDGTTLLGADDKAGVAEILTAAETLIRERIPHRALKVAFTPDEEIGRGADRFDVANFGAPFAYTVDGGGLGEIEYENFNAASADVTVHGFSIHPGDAKNRMKNAILIGMAFNALLPPDQIPASTEGYEGFFHLSRMTGSEEHAELQYIVRDHDREKFEAKKALLLRAADFINARYGAGTVEVALKDTYYNMKEQILPHLFLIEQAEQAMRDAGATPRCVPIRGGTDGARLSYMGLPCPNLSTGGYNFHGRFEFIPLQAMDTMAQVLVNLLRA